ncbi:hypothetical protein BJY01DRAFT_254631 [Aspergillus pseudoustus]|uniref:F-box domain-containing protein n=1 Tax=Aspergillus pseudoustus TaxID=1810923 RepID=A0ABR4IT59_9EURO
MASIWSLLRRIVRRSAAPRSSPLVNLPTELLLLIMEELPLIDQACLALTCKSMHYTFGNVLEHEMFRFPRLYQLRMPELQLQFGFTRRELLRRIANDDDNINYCVKCLKLHRQNQFDLDWSYFAGPPVWKKYCTRDAGIVDLCPCVSMTVFDKRRVIKFLRQKGRGKEAYLAGSLGNAFEQITTEPGYPGLHHKCELRIGDEILARFEATLYITSEKMLMAATEYRITRDDPRMPYYQYSARPDTLYNVVLTVMKLDLDQQLGLMAESQEETGNIGGGTASSGIVKAKRHLGHYDGRVDMCWALQTRTKCESFKRLQEYAAPIYF